MATLNRLYPEAEGGATPDVPFVLNRALRAIDTDVHKVAQAAESARWVKRALVANENLDDLTAAGLYNAGTYALANSLQNRPTLSAAVQRASVEVLPLAGGTIAQRWTTTPGADLESICMKRHRDSAGKWSAWTRADDIAPGSRAEITAQINAVSPALVDWSQKTMNTIVRVLAAVAGDAQPVWGWSAPAGKRLTIPTHDGSGQVVHPSVLHFPSGWNGWKYWMAMTPYPFGNEDHEDPNIVVSNDGNTWTVPAGLVNPLDDAPGKPGPHNSDTHLALGPDGELVCSWRMVDRTNEGRNIIYCRTSRDGITWTPRREVFAPPLGSADSSAVSPALVWLGSKWRMYVVRTVPNPNRLSYYETTAKEPTHADWGPVQDCTVEPGVTASRDWWHVDIQRHGDEWIGILNDVERGTAGVDGDIYLMRSPDGLAWDMSPVPLVPKLALGHDTIYKAGFVPRGSGRSLVLDVFYSAFPRASREFRAYRTTAALVTE